MRGQEVTPEKMQKDKLNDLCFNNNDSSVRVCLLGVDHSGLRQPGGWKN